MSFLAQVRIDSGTVFLQPYEQVGGQEGAMRFLAAEGLPRDELSVTILRALLRSGMALDPGRIKQAYAFFKQRETVSQRAVRAYLLMQSKGLDPTHEGLDRFMDALDGFPDRDTGERGGGHERRDTRGGGDERGGDQGPPGDDREVEETRRIMTRSQQEPTHLLHAFNHLSERNGHWLMVPFSLQAEGRDYRGSIRVHFSGEKPRFDRAVVSADGEQGTWQFELEASSTPGGGAGGSVRVFYPGQNRPPQHLLDELAGRLSDFGFPRLEAQRGENFDGFSMDESLDILKGIDTEA
jgi:hypothetical protein